MQRVLRRAEDAGLSFVPQAEALALNRDDAEALNRRVR